MEKKAYVYFLSNKKNGTIYIGATTNLISRIHAHKNKAVEGFASKYDLRLLVYYEVYEDLDSAFKREMHLKNWNRAWKIKLIGGFNPEWKDLYASILG